MGREAMVDEIFDIADDGSNDLMSDGALIGSGESALFSYFVEADGLETLAPNQPSDKRPAGRRVGFWTWL